MIGDEIGMTAQTVAGPLDLNNNCVMKQPVEQSRRHDRISEHIPPFCKAAVGCEDHGSFFIAGIDELEEQIGSALGHRQIADLVDDQQGSSAVETDLVGQMPFMFRLGQSSNQIRKCCPVDSNHPIEAAFLSWPRWFKTRH